LNRDLGLGGRLDQAPGRLMNRDGTFNVVRGGLEWRRLFHPYHYMLTRSWRMFFVEVFAVYFLANVLFAELYLACGPGAIGSANGTFRDAFFFSVQTLATIGYGKMTPENLGANALVAVESLIGLLGFALVTGLMFARFSRPSVFLAFSEQAVIAPYAPPGVTGATGRALMFRMANGRAANLSELQANVTLAWKNPATGARTFHGLKLERERVAFLTLQWVVVHPIDEASPLYGASEEAFYAAEPEILVQLSGVDEAFFQTASTRRSYRLREIVWGAKFRDIYEPQADGRMYMNVRRLSEADPVALP